MAMIDRRSGNKIAIYGLLLAALVNVVTVVWFAASLSAAVASLAESNTRRDKILSDVTTQVSQIASQLAVVTDRVMRNSDRLDAVKTPPR